MPERKFKRQQELKTVTEPSAVHDAVTRLTPATFSRPKLHTAAQSCKIATSAAAASHRAAPTVSGACAPDTEPFVHAPAFGKMRNGSTHRERGGVSPRLNPKPTKGGLGCVCGQVEQRVAERQDRRRRPCWWYLGMSSFKCRSGFAIRIHTKLRA
jgi:hypothetical protein